MSPVTSITPEAAASLRTLAAAKLRWSLAYATKSFSATPEDKLDYKPAPTSKSPREIIQHLLVGNGHVGDALGIDVTPEEGITDRATLLQKLNESTEAIATKIESLSAEEIDGMVDFLGNPMPMKFFMFIDDWHISRHTGQIDYIQTMWNDMDNYFF